MRKGVMGGRAIGFAVELRLGGRKDGIFAIPLRGSGSGVGRILGRAGVFEDCDSVTGVEEKVQADGEEGGSFEGASEVLAACAAEANVGFDPNGPCTQAVDESEGEVGRDCAAATFTAAGAAFETPSGR